MAGQLQLARTLRKDANRQAIQVANDIITQDGTGTPIESPKSLTTTATFTFVPPAGALVMICRSPAAFRYGDNVTLDGTANEGYMYGPAETDVRIPCADGGSIYIANHATGTNNLYFFFERL